ncbi:hypothetical protein EBB07_13680 [Paenibacillaceae bacterium]|nr:hypothetical protein EBB07_13680 [Paenibacillaceae bacterium]
MSLFSFLFNKEPYLLKVRFDSGNCLLIEASRNGKFVPICKAARNLPRNRVPIFIMKTTEPVLLLHPIDWVRVQDVINELARTANSKKVQISIDDKVRDLIVSEPPKNFQLIYQWDDKRSVLLGRFTEGVQYLGQCWFIQGKHLWRLNDVEDQEISRLLRPIPNNQLIYFMEDILPVVKKRGIPVSFPFSLEREPAVSIVIQNVTSDEIKIGLKKLVNDPHIINGLKGFVIDGSIIRPSLESSIIEMLFPQGTTRILSGEDIPTFVLQALNEWNLFVDKGDVSKLEEHSVYQSAELILEGSYRVKNGVGETYAVAKVRMAGQLISAAELSQQVKPDIRFLRVQNGWVPVERLKEIGIGQMGRMINGQSLESKYKLSPQDIIFWGSERLQGPWEELCLPELEWPQGKNQPVFQHALFLSKWGINGGVFGGVHSCAVELRCFWEEILRESPASRILIIAKKNTLETLKEQWDSASMLWLTGNKKDSSVAGNWRGVLIATSTMLANHTQLRNANIDILIMIEPDEMTKSSTTQVFRNLDGLKTRLRLAIYSEAAHLKQQSTRIAHMKLLKVPSARLEPYVLLDRGRPVPALPKPYKMVKQQMTTFQANDFAEIEISGFERMVAVPTKGSVMQPTQNASYGRNVVIQTAVTYESSEGQFSRRAKQLENHVEAKAAFVPFMAYWPTYDNMTRDQSKWYFYWRNEVRQRRYPHTDLSYIFLLIYELINGIGWRTPLQGYRCFMDVWMAYRDQYPKLDYYLVDWTADFVWVNQLNISTEEVLGFASSGWSSEWRDMELLRLFRAEPLELSYTAISSLSNYDERRSKFYAESGKEVIEAYIPKVMTMVDAYLKKQQGLRTIELFNPGAPRQREKTLFQSAVYDSSIYGQTIVLTVTNISRHEPLRDFVTQVIRAAENKLRELTGYKNKLRGVALDPEIDTLICRYLEREMGQDIKITAVDPVVKINADKLEQLIKDSDAVREMLTTERNETDDFKKTDATLNEVAAEWERPEDTPEGLLTELQPMSKVLNSLSDGQISLLKALEKGNWEMEEYELLQVVGELMIALQIDDINALALNQLGSLLIVHEGLKIIVEDDYRDELEYLFIHHKFVNGEYECELVWEIATNSEPVVQQLSDLLRPEHLEVLFALKNGAAMFEIQQIADRIGTMPELIIDEINDASMETIGDLVVVDGVIVEEYHNLFENLRER